MSAPSPADWRQHDTPEFWAFANAQARLDDDDYEPGEDGRVLRQRDEVLTADYDRRVLQPAQAEREQREARDHEARMEWEYFGRGER